MHVIGNARVASLWSTTYSVLCSHVERYYHHHEALRLQGQVSLHHGDRQCRGRPCLADIVAEDADSYDHVSRHKPHQCHKQIQTAHVHYHKPPDAACMQHTLRHHELQSRAQAYDGAAAQNSLGAAPFGVPRLGVLDAFFLTPPTALGAAAALGVALLDFAATVSC